MTSTTLKWQHSSMQFSDSDKQIASDVADLLGQATDFPIKTGTEGAVGERVAPHLIAAAKEHNHRIHFWRDNWIAVDRGIIAPRTFLPGFVFVADNDETVGPGHDSGFATVQFEHAVAGVGTISIASCHYPIKGRTPSDPNWDINHRYADCLGLWGSKAGRGNALAFVSGDFNMPFGPNKPDVFFGHPFTSAWEEMGKYDNTGHGNIDGVASYDHDGRVSAKWIKALDDEEFPQFSDHFVVRASFRIQHIARHPVA